MQISLVINIDSSMVSEDFDLAYRSILPLEVYGDKDKPFSPAHCREALQVLDLQIQESKDSSGNIFIMHTQKDKNHRGYKHLCSEKCTCTCMLPL